MDQQFALEHRTDSLRRYFRDIARSKPLKPDVQSDLALRYQAGDKEAGRKLIASNARLVVKLAMRYQHRGLPLQDIIQEGNIALFAAARKFNPERGAKFSTYATLWIRSVILRELSRAGTVHASTIVAQQASKLLREKGRIKMETARDASAEEINKAMGGADIQAIEFAVALSVSSLDLPLEEGSEETRVDHVAGKEPLPDADAERDEMLGLIRAAMKPDSRIITNRERTVLMMRYFSSRQMTLELVAAELGVTRERVRQIENEAIGKLKRNLNPA